MKSKEDNTENDEGLFTPPSCFLFACGAFACDFGEGGGDENVIGVTNASSQSHRDIERSGGAWTKNERRRTFEMSMIPEGDEFCITSAKEKKGNNQEEERRDGDDDTHDQSGDDAGQDDSGDAGDEDRTKMSWQ